MFLAFKKKLNIEFIGLIKEKKHLMALFKYAKLAIYPSMHEGMSNTLLEMTSMKTPVICSDIPENKNVFNKDEILFFKNKVVNDLSEKILWALDHLELMHDKADKAYLRLEREYNWEHIAQTYSENYKQLIATK